MGAGRLRRLLTLVGAIIMLGTLLLAGWYMQAGAEQRLRACIHVGICNEPAEVLGTTLLSFRKQQQLVVFSARLVTALTAVDERSVLGMKLAEARKTLIVPATVRYALDLQKLEAEDMHWNPATSTLTLNRPPLLILGPEIDIAMAQEYVDGKLLLAFTRTEAKLDQINREQARDRLLQEARQPVLLDLAHKAGDDALRRTFELPLQVAGFEAAKVEIRE